MKTIFRFSALLPARLLSGWFAAPILSGLICLSESYAQSCWVIQTSGTTNQLYGVSFTDANMGSGGTILRTTTGGVVWGR